MVPCAALLISGLYAFGSWNYNEKKWKQMIRQEEEQGDIN